MKVPWDYSKAMRPGDPGAVPNAPTPEGIALGRELARLCDAEEQKQLDQFPGQPPRCDDCAFRAGTIPNGCPDTLMDALKCVLEGEPFYCHKGMKDQDADPKRLCSGWMVLQTPGGEEFPRALRAAAHRALEAMPPGGDNGGT